MDRTSTRVAFCGAAKDDKDRFVRRTYVCRLDNDDVRVLKRDGPHDFSPDGKSLALGDRHDVCLVEIATDKVQQLRNLLPADSKKRVVFLAYSPDGATLAVLAEDDKIYLLDAATLKAKKTCHVAEVGNIHALGWVDDRTVVCRTSSDAKILVVVDTVNGELKKSYSRSLLCSQLPAGRENWDKFLGFQVVPGTTKVLIRTYIILAAGEKSNTNYLLDWATGELGKPYRHTSNFGSRRPRADEDKDGHGWLITRTEV